VLLLLDMIMWSIDTNGKMSTLAVFFYCIFLVLYRIDFEPRIHEQRMLLFVFLLVGV